MKRRAAFSMVELIVASGLLSLVLIFVVALFPHTSQGIQRADEQFLAEAVAASRLEQVAAAPYQDLAPNTPMTLPSESAQAVTFQLELEQDPVPSYDFQNLKALRLTLRWQSQGASRSMTRVRYWVKGPS